jgi:hypothetical protein
VGTVRAELEAAGELERLTSGIGTIGKRRQK